MNTIYRISLLAALATLTACDPPDETDESGSPMMVTDSETGGGATSNSGPGDTTSTTEDTTTTDSSTDSGTTDSSMTTSAGDGDGDGDGDSDSGGDADTGFGMDIPSPGQCSVFEQDCPVGEHCIPWATVGGPWDANVCRPIDGPGANPGEPCTGGTNQTDSCGVGSYCWAIDPETGMGNCIELCGGTEMSPTCSGAVACTIYNQGVLPLCASVVCDPATCADPNTCMVVPGGTQCCDPNFGCP